MSERYWYQNGWTVFSIVCVAGFFGFSAYYNYEKAQRDALPQVVPRVTGKLNQPLLGDSSLEITVWHQHPATLRNVVLLVSLNEDPLRDEKQWDRREHSFEAWQPNQENAFTFSFPLKRYDPKQEIYVGYGLIGKTIKPFISGGEWLVLQFHFFQR